MTSTPPICQLHFFKKKYKFSAAHFTIFSKEHAERLHGHNYQLSLSMEWNWPPSPSQAMIVDFNKIKPFIEDVCQTLDEYVLIPTENQHLSVETDGNNYIISHGKKVYSLPKEDVRLLKLENITAEGLAGYCLDLLREPLTSQFSPQSIEVQIAETEGQAATIRQSF